MTIYEAIGDNIRKAREDAGLTGKQLGEKIGAGKQTISGYETGRTRQPVDVLIKIAKECNVTLDQLITGQKSQDDAIAHLSPEEQDKIKSVLNKRPNTRPLTSVFRLGWGHKITPPEEALISDAVEFAASEDTYEEISGIIDQLQKERDELYYRVEDLLNQNVDFALIKQVIETAMEHLQQNELEMAPDKFAELVEVLYEEITETGAEEVNKGTVARLIKLAM